MATPGRLDCSLDQLIDQSEDQQQPRGPTRSRNGANGRPMRRIVDASSINEILDSNKSVHQTVSVKKQPIKRQYNQGNSRGSHGGQQNQKLTPTEAAIHGCTVRKADDGDVVVAFKDTEVLNSGGFRTFSTRAVLCAALQPVGLKVDETGNKASDEEAAKDSWTVSDGRAFLQKFEDGMTICQIGRLTRHQLLARPSVILQFMQQKKAGLAKKANRGHRQPSGALHRRRHDEEQAADANGMMETVD